MSSSPVSLTAPSTEATEAEKHGRDDENQDVQQEPKVKKPRLEVDGMTYSTKFIMPTGYDFHVVYKRALPDAALLPALPSHPTPHSPLRCYLQVSSSCAR